MSNCKYVLMLWIALSFQFSAGAQSEAYYIDEIATMLQGKQEVSVENGRVDIVTDAYAIEVEWASNWKHSIGQALWYGLQTNKKPGIILLMKGLDDRKYGIRLQSAIDYAGLTDKIKVWFYPEDFGRSFTQVEQQKMLYNQNRVATLGNYTVNKSSGIRHNSKCPYFECKNCVPCGPSDGSKACGKCGG
ncbi:MAG: hypothetical protein LC107_06985 [Chitinophagales bacterium]|nr:hypothetical protein [Chitinophagales bacterium]